MPASFLKINSIHDLVTHAMRHNVGLRQGYPVLDEDIFFGIKTLSRDAVPASFPQEQCHAYIGDACNASQRRFTSGIFSFGRGYFFLV